MSLRACKSVTWPVRLTDWLTDARWPTGEVRRSDATRCDARDGEREEGGEGGMAWHARVEDWTHCSK